MSVLVYAELAEGAIKKTSLEAINYAKQTADLIGSDCIAIAIGKADENALKKAGEFGASKVLHANADTLVDENIYAYAQVLIEAVKATSSNVIIAAKSSLADAITARAAGTLKAGIVGNAVSLPDVSNGFSVKRSIFTGKAFAYTSFQSEIKIIAIKKNAITIKEGGSPAPIEVFNPSLGAECFTAKIISIDKESGEISLPEADIVVSGGRGMKGPEHWQPLLDLAEALGAATACSKPVSDMDWRPHHEHVGQTGVKIAPNLYIACGISGAIQHLAGVNSSKVIVVINNDPEAPFFKAADYGIVGDAFEVLPKLTAALKK